MEKSKPYLIALPLISAVVTGCIAFMRAHDGLDYWAEFLGAGFMLIAFWFNWLGVVNGKR